MYRRDNRVYYSPAQVTVFLNGYLVDDACRIRYRALDNWTPVYGYQDVLWRDVVMGQTLVEGELAINYRYEGYLFRVIQQALGEERSLAKSISEVVALRKGQGARDLKDATLNQETTAVLNWLDNMMATPPEGGAPSSANGYSIGSDFLKDRFWSQPEWGNAIEDSGMPSSAERAGATQAADSDTKEDLDKQMSYMRPSIGKSPRRLSMKIVHGADHHIDKPEFNRVIHQVQFREQSYIADAGVPGGNNAVMEIYPFIARNVGPLRVSNQQKGR